MQLVPRSFEESNCLTACINPQTVTTQDLQSSVSIRLDEVVEQQVCFNGAGVQVINTVLYSQTNYCKQYLAPIGHPQPYCKSRNRNATTSGTQKIKQTANPSPRSKSDCFDTEQVQKLLLSSKIKSFSTQSDLKQNTDNLIILKFPVKRLKCGWSYSHLNMHSLFQEVLGCLQDSRGCQKQTM